MSTYVITGAARGIGLELTRQLSARGERVIALCRTATPELEQLKVQVEEGVDVTDDGVGALLHARLHEVRIDVLIHNAGLLSRETLHDLNLERIRRQFEVNTLGPLKVTQGLLSHLHSGSKVLIVSSRMGSVADNTSGGFYGYRMSKAAANMAGRSLSHDLQARGIAVGLLHPGYVRTEMTGHQGQIDADEAARGLIARMDELSLETSGSFWHMNGELIPW